MCSDAVISVKNLTKTYRVFGHPGDRISTFFNLHFCSPLMSHFRRAYVCCFPSWSLENSATFAIIV